MMSEVVCLSMFVRGGFLSLLLCGLCARHGAYAAGVTGRTCVYVVWCLAHFSAFWCVQRVLTIISRGKIANECLRSFSPKYTCNNRATESCSESYVLLLSKIRDLFSPVVK